MRERRQRKALLAAVLAISAAAALFGWRMLAGRPAAPGEPAEESPGAVVTASADATAVATSPSAPVEPTRCAPEPPLESGTRLSGAFSRVVFGHENPWGTASVGTPTRGSLIGAVELEVSEGIELAGDYHWGTGSVVRSIERAVREVRRCHPGSPDIYVGDISREGGGWLRPHRSHQAGLDADIGFYYSGPASWYERATAKNLDVVRTWALFRALVDGGNVEMIFVDRSVQDLMKAHLAKLPASKQPPEGFFEKSSKSPAVVRHAWGHATHFHVRFRDTDAVELGLALVDPNDKRPKPIVRVQPKRPAKGRYQRPLGSHR
jgi:hypothetical protein